MQEMIQKPDFKPPFRYKIQPPSSNTSDKNTNVDFLSKQDFERKFEELSRRIPILQPNMVPPPPYYPGPFPYMPPPGPPFPNYPPFQIPGGVEPNSSYSSDSIPPQTHSSTSLPVPDQKVIDPQSMKPLNSSSVISEETKVSPIDFAFMSKFLKTSDKMQIYAVVMLQYFTFDLCGIQPQANWTKKEEFSSLELLSVLTICPQFLGEDLESIVQSVWSTHLSKTVYSYVYALTIIIASRDRIETVQLMTNLNRKLGGFSKDILLGLKDKRVSFSGLTRDLKAESRIKAKIRHVTQNLLNSTALTILETASRIALQIKDFDITSVDAVISDYPEKCGWVLEMMGGLITWRASLAEKKKTAKEAKKAGNMVTIDPNVAEAAW